MKQKGLVYVLIAIGLIAVLSSFGNANGVLNLAALDPDTYGQQNIQRLINLYNSILRASDPNTGQPLSTNQQLLMLSQALVETGLFTASPNYNLMDNYNNFAGIKANSRYSAGSGGVFAAYPSLDAFVQDWLTVLNFNSSGTGPAIEASTPDDFINHLLANGYIVQGDLGAYSSALPAYYSLLSNTEVSQAA